MPLGWSIAVPALSAKSVASEMFVTVISVLAISVLLVD
jgi:hypothetical protein